MAVPVSAGSDPENKGRTDPPPEAATGRPGVKRRWWRAWILEPVLLLAVIGGISWWQSRGLLDGSGARPALRGTTLTGEAWEYIPSPGRPTLIYFFATWCGVCKVTGGNAERAGRWLGDGRVQTLAVALDYESADEVRQYVADRGLGMPVLLGDDQVRQDWRIGAFPTFYLLDAEGRIDHTAVGYTTTGGLLWRLLF